MHWSFFLCFLMLPVASDSYYLGLPAVMDWILELWAKGNSLKLLIPSYFIMAAEKLTHMLPVTWRQEISNGIFQYVNVQVRTYWKSTPSVILLLSLSVFSFLPSLNEFSYSIFWLHFPSSMSSQLLPASPPTQCHSSFLLFSHKQAVSSFSKYYCAMTTYTA